jgi:raffinose/stachyose/melibiose transport system permease protein
VQSTVLDNIGAPTAPSESTATPAPVRRRGGARLRRRPERIGDVRPPRGTGWAIALSLLPALLVFATFFLVPLGVLVVTSLGDWSGAGFQYSGLDNFRTMLGDDTFWKAAKNTLTYCFFGLAIQLPLGVLIGVMLSERLPGWRFFRAIIFVPYVISGAAYALIFALFYNADHGLLNGVVHTLGLGEGRDWLYTSSSALPAVAGTFVFIIGFNAILVMAEVGSIPRELYEAAELDGATVFQRHRLITLPLLRNVIGTLVLITLLGYLALFDVVFILTAGGPDNATVTLTLYAYRAYQAGSWGYANAVGVTIVLVGLLLIVGARRAFRIGERTL